MLLLQLHDIFHLDRTLIKPPMVIESAAIIVKMRISQLISQSTNPLFDGLGGIRINLVNSWNSSPTLYCLASKSTCSKLAESAITRFISYLFRSRMLPFCSILCDNQD
jgi:hypothetical protein